MSRRLFTVVAAVAAALLLVPAALAVRVHVRVEGKTRTIFGAAEPSGVVAGEQLPSQRRDRPGLAPGSLTALLVTAEPIIARCETPSAPGLPSSSGQR